MNSLLDICLAQNIQRFVDNIDFEWDESAYWTFLAQNKAGLVDCINSGLDNMVR